MTTTADTDAFVAAMESGDLDALAATLSPQVTMNSPILVDPVSGRDAILKIMTVIFQVASDIRYFDLMNGDGIHAMRLTAQVGEHALEGIEAFHVDDNGLIDEVTIAMRPLPALVAFQNALAGVLGVPALTLTPAA